MFRIKICGITNVEDAIAAVDAGAEAIGLNFYAGSPRYVSEEVAYAICTAVDFRADCIGVYVNAEKGVIDSKVTLACLHGIQLHGDETPEFAACVAKKMPIGDISPSELMISAERANDPELVHLIRSAMPSMMPSILIRARRFDDRGVAAIRDDLEACIRAGGAPSAVLVDAASPGRYGGTGETVSWVGLADHKRWLGDTPLILAGGLTPENVAEAIRIVRPAAVDVASGVEALPGKKDPAKVRDFVAAARSAF